MGARYHKYAEEFTEVFDQDNVCILEIGSENGDGSTSYFNDLSIKKGCDFYTVDIDLKEFNFQNPKFHQYTMSGEKFLEETFPSLEKKIAVLYLDNFDWIWEPLNIPDWINNQITMYKDKFGLDMNNVESSTVHLKQAIGALPYLAEKSVVICDDTWYARSNGVFMGKSCAAIYYLLAHGFKVVKQDDLYSALILSNY